MPPISPYDQLLVLRAQEGDGAAMDRLVERWYGALLRQARRILQDREAARDAVQEAWLAIVRGMSRLEDPMRFPAWALRITTFKAMDHLRRLGHRRCAEERAAAPVAEEVGALADDESAVVRAAVAALPSARRVVVELHYMESLAVHDIAEVLGLPPGTVKSRLFEARNELRATLERRTNPPSALEK